MTITDDIVKGFRNPTPLYAVAGTADLAAEKLREVPALIVKVREQAPERFEKLRSTDPKVVQERVAAQAKDVQERVSTQAKDARKSLSELDLNLNLKELPDLRKIGESVQDLALQGVGRAAEYAVKARETYDELAERGKGAVATWRGEAADGVVEIAAAVEPEPSAKPAAKKPAARKTTPKKPVDSSGE
jgi:hypothetical protein